MTSRAPGRIFKRRSMARHTVVLPDAVPPARPMISGLVRVVPAMSARDAFVRSVQRAGSHQSAGEARDRNEDETGVELRGQCARGQSESPILWVCRGEAAGAIEAPNADAVDLFSQRRLRCMAPPRAGAAARATRVARGAGPS